MSLAVICCMLGQAASQPTPMPDELRLAFHNRDQLLTGKLVYIEKEAGSEERLIRATFGGNAYILDYGKDKDSIDGTFVDDDGRNFAYGGMNYVTLQFGHSMAQDPRQLGLGLDGLERALHTRDNVRYEVSRSGDLLIVKSIKGLQRIEITIDPSKQFSVTELVRTSAHSKVPAQRTILQLGKFDGFWFPRKIITFREEMKTGETTVVSAELNRAAHNRHLTFSDAGLVTGSVIQTGDAVKPERQGKEQLVWDAENRRTLNRLEYSKALRDGTFMTDPRLEAIRHRNVAAGTDPYTRYAMAFASDFHLTKPQLSSAFGIANDVKRSTPATQPSEISAALENSLRPRLLSLLTEEQRLRKQAPRPNSPPIRGKSDAPRERR